jgi:Ras-associated and pleckstrin homology domains-containing protein 1
LPNCLTISSRNLLLEEFFANNNPISLEGPLYLKSESKKGWKRYHFVLRQSGLYYYPKEKEKVKSSKDLMCLALFNSHNVYKGVGWKKKYKAPTDHSFALKCPKVNITGKGMKMMCAEDPETLEKWIMCCRIAKYGKKLVDNFKILVEDLARDDLDKLASTRLSFTPITTQMSSEKLNINNQNQNGRLSRTSTSSSSSGCLSDDNNGFDNEFTTGTIKRKPTMKPNLPLTTKTRQLIKEVEDNSSRSDCNDSLEKGGTLTHCRSHSSSSSGTLKRQGSNRCSIDSMKSFNSPTASEEPFIKPTQDVIDSGGHPMTSCMTDSMLSLPPPPEPTTCAMSASSLSLNNLPFPDPPDENILKELSMDEMSDAPQTSFGFQDENTSNKTLNYAISSMNGKVESEPIYKTILKPPPYKSPPVHNKYSLPPPVPQKSVTFADSALPPPVVMRKKVCFDDHVEKIVVAGRHEKPMPIAPPIRDKTTFLTTASPKRLSESSCNPPQDFWKDLQRVVNKKLSVAQKCKMNLQMSPGEVLGFRDAEPTYESTYYRETSTSNWVLEHYGDNLYENWDGTKVDGSSLQQNGVVLRDPNAMQKQNIPLSPQRRSTRGPPVPVRNSTTRLSSNSYPSSGENQ